VTWTTKKGYRSSVRIDEWKPVNECFAIPEPDTSWMTKPMKRKDLAGWLDS
jgi:hypothetical protein